jgi:hypothetical protein
MQFDPVAEWQRLTEFYRGKTDAELEELAEDFGNLTETAQQVLTTELRSRCLALPGSQQASSPTQPRPFAGYGSSHLFEHLTANSDESQSDADTDEAPIEFTWKTQLCECDDGRQAWQLAKALELSGIESWVQSPGSGVVYWRVFVPADQLEESRAVADQPIPQDIVEESKDFEKEPEEYIPPTCPKCRTEDPILESADPSNNWLCEACGALWSDPLPDPVPNSAPDPARSPK